MDGDESSRRVGDQHRELVLVHINLAWFEVFGHLVSRFVDDKLVHLLDLLLLGGELDLSFVESNLQLCLLLLQK